MKPTLTWLLIQSKKSLIQYQMMKLKFYHLMILLHSSLITYMRQKTISQLQLHCL